MRSLSAPNEALRQRDPVVPETDEVDSSTADTARRQNAVESSPTHTLPQREWDKAKARREAIRAAAAAGPPYLPQLRIASQKFGFGISSLYRYLSRYGPSADLRALLDAPKNQPRRPRLDRRVIAIILEAFQKRYLAPEKLCPADICRDVLFECWRSKLPRPHANTIRNHVRKLIASTGERQVHRKRGNNKMAESLSMRHGTFKDYDKPGSLIMVDHTKLDLMLVDEEDRQSVGRAFITVALDVSTRVIAGFYISLDPVGTLSTGLCLLHAIFPKNDWLNDLGITHSWPDIGLPTALHFDNAKEFLGKTVQRFCDAYDVRIEHRPLGLPHFGGHIERVIKTLNRELHRIPGTTFSNTREREDYDSEGLACMTLRECEAFVAEWISGEYHKRIHSGLGRSPLRAYEIAISGASDGFPMDAPRIPEDKQKVRLDLLPWEYRTVQRTGIEWDSLWYVGEVLGPYTKTKNDDGTTRRFIVARDPRRINEAFFFAPDAKEYFTLKLRNATWPHLSIWEWNELRRRLAADGKKDADEDAIFASYGKRQQMIDEAVKTTKRVRRERTRRLHHARADVYEPPRVAEQSEWVADVEPIEGARSW